MSSRTSLLALGRARISSSLESGLQKMTSGDLMEKSRFVGFIGPRKHRCYVW